MKLKFKISIELQEQPRPTYGSRINISDVRAFEKIEELGFEETTKTDGWGRRIRVKCDADDSRVHTVLEILQTQGFSPSRHSVVPPDRRDREFRTQISRFYDEADIKEAPLLRLDPRGVNKDIARDWKSEAGQWKIKIDRLQNSELEIGTLTWPPTYLVSAALKDSMIEEGLVGMAFREVLYDKPNRVVKRLWQFVPGLEMPPCLTPRVDAMSGDPPNDGVTQFVAWDDGPYSPQELRFDRDEVAAIGDFDVALTRETVGNFVGERPVFRPEIIISQRVHEFLKRRKIRSVGYVPVRLE